MELIRQIVRVVVRHPLAIGKVREVHCIGSQPALLVPPVAIWTHIIIPILIIVSIVNPTVFHALTGTHAKPVPTDI